VDQNATNTHTSFIASLRLMSQLTSAAIRYLNHRYSRTSVIPANVFKFNKNHPPRQRADEWCCCRLNTAQPAIYQSCNSLLHALLSGYQHRLDPADCKPLQTPPPSPLLTADPPLSRPFQQKHIMENLMHIQSTHERVEAP